MTLKKAEALAASPTLTIARTFAATPERVFTAWCAAEHVRRWFCPQHCSVPQAKIEPRVGGAFELCMRLPDGTEHWMQGRFVQVDPPRRLVIDAMVGPPQGDSFFRVRTVASFEPMRSGTRLQVVQSYEPLQPQARAMIGGAERGWAETLDRLGALLSDASMAAIAPTPVVHDSFRISRRYEATPAEVFHALTDPHAKARWFGAGKGLLRVVKREMDVRPGGRETVICEWEGGKLSTFEALYHDIVPGQRLVYSYDMFVGEQKISVSLATFELRVEGAGSALTFTEQVAFLDGYQDGGSRERGTRALLEALGQSLGG